MSVTVTEQRIVGLPGDRSPDERVQQMIRVDHAGEYGAARIYAGQLAILGRGPKGDLLRHMRDQEREHLSTFSEIVGRRRVRPTVLLPLWDIAGFALGAITAAMGERAAMACTVAVEETIEDHYAEQAASLPEHEHELRAVIEKFREEELEHRDIGLANEAELTVGYRALSAVIKAGLPRGDRGQRTDLRRSSARP